MLWQLLVVLVLCQHAQAGIYAGAPTDTYRDCLNHPPRRKDGYVSIADEEHDWTCIQRTYQRNAEYHGISRERTENQTQYIRSLYEDLEVASEKAMEKASTHNDCQPKLERKEYRIMTDVERATFHRALQKLKNTPSVAASYYDALALLHVGNPGAHEGPAFLNWHRIYLQMFETALRREEPTAILPYWASSWDNEMTTPTNSIMWDLRFAGNGFGIVKSGPAAYWPSPVSLLSRNIGVTGGLITQHDIDNVMSQNSLVGIATPFAAPQNNLEEHHNKVHNFVGGQMSSLGTAPYDFVFYLHHAFIDCIYEQFRLRQIENNIDPDTDWPVAYVPAHAPNAPISLRPFLTNIEVSKREYACAKYDPVCTRLIYCDCNQRCPSKYLTCDRERSICIPIEGRGGGGGDGECCGQSSGYSYGGGGNGGGRYTPYGTDDTYTRPGNRYRRPGRGEYGPASTNAIQNNYCIDERRCGTDYWAYIPIQINSYRPPNRRRHDSYRIQNGRPQTTYDIYDPRGYNQQGVYYRSQQGYSQSPNYRNCPCRSNSGGVYVQTYGNTYEGNYREYQPLDMRQPMSTATSYVAVKNPRYGSSDSIVRVYDECGRMCRPRCRYTGSNSYVDCDGLLRITENASQDRRSYGETYEDAMNLVYTYEDRGEGRSTPTYNANNIDVIYDCDYRGAWPWRRQADQSYNLTGYQGDTSYRPPSYEDPRPYVRLPTGGYY